MSLENIRKELIKEILVMAGDDSQNRFSWTIHTKSLIA
jgi:hypothetical protein